MIFLPVFDNFLISHFIEVSLAVYLLAYLSYAVAYNGAFEFSFPPLLKSTLSFSVFILIISFVSLVTISAVCEFDGAKNPSNSMLLIIVFRCLVLLSSIGILLITRTYADTQRIIKYEYDMLIMFSILSLLILSSSDDFLMLYLAIELQSLCFYVLATFKRNSVFSTEAGLKYFILGAFSSGLLLFGFVLSYVTFGTTSFETLAKLTIGANGYLAFWGYLFVMFAFFFKVGAAPFHMWLCDVYEGSLTSVTAFFATVPKIVLFSLIIQLSLFVFKGFDSFSSILLGFCGLMSICIASVAALYQRRLKRLLAYSTISHTGFILLGVSCGSVDSIKACAIYIILYAFMSLSVFSVVLLSSGNIILSKYIVQWTALSRQNILFALSFSIILFSMAGIPPLAGFFSKLGILLSMLAQDYTFVALVIVLFSSVGCFYYIRLIKVMFFTEALKVDNWVYLNSNVTCLVLAITLTVVVLFLVFPGFILNISALVALSLF